MAAPPATAVGSLFTATSPRIAALMTPDGDPAARDALFNEWIAALTIPLRPKLDAMSLSRYTLDDATRLLLLESPEPLPFSRDVRVTLARVTGGHWPPHWPGDLVDAVGDRVSARVGGLALLDGRDLAVLGDAYPVNPWPLPPAPPTFAVLTDASECRALLIPVRNGGATTLDDGRWRLDFALDRERWHEQAPASPASRLTATASITVTLV